MDVTWGEDFEVLAEVARSVFAKDSPLADDAQPVSYADKVRQLAELDWLQLGDPVGDSEMSADLRSVAALFVEMGRSLSQSPLLPLIMTRDIALLIGTPRATEVAGAVGEGRLSVLPVLTDPRWANAPVVLHGNVVNGTALAVAYADQAQGFLVLARDGNQSALVLVDAAEVEVEEMPNLGGEPLFAVSFDDALVAEGDVLSRGPAADGAVTQAQQRAAVLLAAQVYGAGTKLQEITVRYANERHQFGGPIGRFQAVQYLCTDIAISVHLVSVLVRNAAREIDEGLDPAVHVALMARQAARSAQVMVHSAHEVHAGIGFMLESHVHQFTKAAKAWQFALEDARHDQTIATHFAAATGRISHSR